MPQKNTLFIIFLVVTNYLFSQIDGNSLLNIPIVSTTTEMNAILSATPPPTTGALIFNDEVKKIYEFNGTIWKQLLETAIVDAKTASYTLTASDYGNVLTFNSATDVILTIPTGLPVGFNISIYQIGTGKVTITGAGGVQIKNRLQRFRTAGLDAGVGIIATATNVFHITGDLKK